jgi:Na+-transporting methylmalonyl-CoA/oxaloacetate decarboxylase gamma subunit
MGLCVLGLGLGLVFCVLLSLIICVVESVGLRLRCWVSTFVDYRAAGAAAAAAAGATYTRLCAAINSLVNSNQQYSVRAVLWQRSVMSNEPSNQRDCGC